MINTVLEKFEHFGFLIQTPGTDKTYFLTKQTEKGTRQIWIKLIAIPEIECKFNYKSSSPSSKEMDLISELLQAHGYNTYNII